MDAPVWDITVFTKNRERLLADDLAVDHPPSRLRGQPAPAQTHRGTVRLDQKGNRRRKTLHRGLPRVGWMVTLTAAACNLMRLPKLLMAAA